MESRCGIISIGKSPDSSTTALAITSSYLVAKEE
jgi:hypothetical protein